MADDPKERIGPTKERLKKGDTIVDDEVTMGEGPNKVTTLTRRAQDTLDMLNSRGVLSGDQFTAGRQLYDDWYVAGLAASGVIDPSKDVVDGGRIDHMSERKLDAMGRFAKALIAVGKVHSNPLINIVLMGESLMEYGYRRDKYRDVERCKLAATTYLKAALTELDYHYYGQRKTRKGKSHLPDYRPAIHGKA